MRTKRNGQQFFKTRYHFTPRFLFVACVAFTLVVVASPKKNVEATTSSITGVVFQDFNSNGTRDTATAIGVAVDSGVSGIVVRAFDATGAQVGSATTASNGSYTLTISGASTTSVRVEFSIPSGVAALDGLQPSFATSTGASGSTHGSAVQFATVGDTGVNFAVNRPGEYCQNNPTLVLCASEAGTGSTTNVGAFTVPTAMSGFTDFAENSTRIGSSRQLGAVFGIGTDRSRNSFYGTYVKRHVEYGSAGAVNAIYRINHDNPGVVSTFVTLPGTLPAHDPTVVAGFTAYSGDTAVFDQVGRIGLGDVDVTDDGLTLLAIDMNQAAPKLWFVPIIGSGNAVTSGNPSSISIPMPSPFGGVQCPGTWHPMGIGTRGNRILVGGVCGAENTVTPSTPRGTNPTQSSAFILEYTGSRNAQGSFTTIWASSLSYARSCVYRENPRIPCDPATSTVGSVASADWAAWNGYPNLAAIDGPTGGLFASNPQAMLSNIEITDSGDLVVGLRDRFQDQIMTGQPAYSLAYANQSYPQPPLAYPRGIGTMAGGDIIRVCRSGSTYATESNGTCTELEGSKALEFGMSTREYYYDPYDNGFADATGPLHSETAQGATASMPGYSGLWAAVYDVRSLGEQGVMSFGSCGAATAGTTCRGPSTGFGSQNGGYGFGNLNNFNKGIGLTDIEVLCDSAPVQIGDRVWIDADADGIQDSDELPVSGVTVRLYDSSGVLIATTTTNSDGEYVFSSTSSGLTTGEEYTIRFDNPADYASGGPLAGYGKTTKDATTSVSDDIENAIDSDAVVVGGFPRISVPELSAGENNHTFDVGFVPLVGVGGVAWADANGDGVQDAGESPLSGVMVELLDTAGNPAVDTNGNQVPSQMTGADGTYFFDGLSPGEYQVKFTQPSGYVFTAVGGGSSQFDSDADRQTGVTAPFVVMPVTGGNVVVDSDPGTTASFVNPSIAAGFVPVVSVGNFVWSDLDNDGAQDASEPGLSGVTVSLTTSQGNPVMNVFGQPVTPTVTDSQGFYSFDNLPTGQYTVTVETPNGYVPTVLDGGTRETDSSSGSDTSANLVTPGSRDDTLDFGFVRPPIAPPVTPSNSGATPRMPHAGTDNSTLFVLAVVILLSGLATHFIQRKLSSTHPSIELDDVMNCWENCSLHEM